MIHKIREPLVKMVCLEAEFCECTFCPSEAKKRRLIGGPSVYALMHIFTGCVKYSEPIQKGILSTNLEIFGPSFYELEHTLCIILPVLHGQGTILPSI